MSLHARPKRSEQRANGYKVTHTPAEIFYQMEEEIPALIAQAAVCPCCTVHMLLPAKRREPMRFERRLQRLERLHIRQLAAAAGKPYGLSADDILDEARRLAALSAAEQDAEFADALAQAQARDDHEAVRLLSEGWAAVRSYR